MSPAFGRRLFYGGTELDTCGFLAIELNKSSIFIIFCYYREKTLWRRNFFSQIFVFPQKIWRIFVLNFTFSTHHEGKKFFPLTLLCPTFSYMNVFKIPTATLVNDILTEKIWIHGIFCMKYCKELSQSRAMS